MMNRTIVTVAVLALFVVTVGAAQLVYGRSDDTQAAEMDFPQAAPYVEPTATATATPTVPAPDPTATPPVLPPADVPGDDLAGLPRYPDSVRVAYGATSTETDTSISVEYATLDTLEAVHEHVRDSIHTFGWHVAGEEFTAASLRFVLERDGERAVVHLYLADGLTMMSIDYSRTIPEAQVVEEESVPEPVVDPETTTDPPPSVPEAPPPGPPEHAVDDQNEPVEEQENEPEQKPEHAEKPENHPGNNGNGNGGDSGNNGNGNGNGNGGNSDNNGNGNSGGGPGNSGNGNQGNGGGGNDKKKGRD